MKRRLLILPLALALIATGCGGGGAPAVGGPNPGGPATRIKLSNPEALVFDSSGNLYISELEGNRVLRIAPSGKVTRIAGRGTRGYSGDGRPAVVAEISQPNGIALDDKGNLAIADWGNNVIRKVDSKGRMTTLLRSDKLDQPVGLTYHDGDLYIADYGKGTIIRLRPDGTLSAVQEGVHAGYLAFDAQGNLDFTDSGRNTVSQVDSETVTTGRQGVISELAGNETAGFSGDGGPAVDARLNLPYGLAVDGEGNVYFSDAKNNRVRRISTDGIITTVAGTARGFGGDGGPATAAKLDIPAGLAIDARGNLYISDQLNDRVRRVDAATGVIATVAGNGARK